MRILALGFVALRLLAQTLQATVQVEVSSESGPVSGAKVTLNSEVLITNPNGIITAPVSLGTVKVAVSKEGYLPSTTLLDVDAARAWFVQVELRPAEAHEEEITVYATRNDVRIQDSPVRVEVLQREEIEDAHDARRHRHDAE